MKKPKTRLENVITFLKLAWWAAWNWAIIACVEQDGQPVQDEVGDGCNTLYNLHVRAMYIDTTTKWYILKKAWRKAKNEIARLDRQRD